METKTILKKKEFLEDPPGYGLRPRGDELRGRAAARRRQR